MLCSPPPATTLASSCAGSEGFCAPCCRRSSQRSRIHNRPKTGRTLLLHERLEEPDVDGLRSLAALDHIDGYSLAFQQISEAAATERRCMHENVSATAVPNDKSKPLIGVVPLDR